MSVERPSPDQGNLSDEEVHRVLERAVHLDMRASESLSYEQLSAIAGEAGISQGALETALGEVVQGRNTPALPNNPSEAKEIQGGFSLRHPARWSRPAWFLAGAIGISAVTAVLYVISAVLQNAR